MKKKELKAERDYWKGSHEGISSAYTQLQLKHKALMAERDNLVLTNKGLVHDRSMAEAEVERLTAQCGDLRYERDYNSAMWVDMKLERDALQARIDAGRPLVTADNCWWTRNIKHKGAHTTGLIIDIQPIAEALPDERKHRETISSSFAGMSIFEYNGTKYVSGPDRRRTPGTRADRRAS